VNKKQFQALPSDVKRLLTPTINSGSGWQTEKPTNVKVAGEVVWYTPKDIRRLLTQMKARYYIKFYYQGSLPYVVVESLRKFNIEFYGRDFTGNNPLNLFEDIDKIITQKMIKRRLRR
jgi:hypothetical protein